MNQELLLLLIVAAASAGAFAKAYDTPVWLMLAPCVALLRWRIERVPRWLARAVQSLANLTCFAAILMIQVFIFLPITQEFGPKRSMFFLGYWITLLITIVLLGSKVWKPASGPIPLSVTLLTLAFYKLNINMLFPLAVAGAGLFGYLALTAAQPGRESIQGARLRRLALYAGLSLALAWGCAQGLWLAQDVFERQLYAYFSAPSLFSPGLFADSELGSLEELKLSPRVVLRLWSERPQKLRGRVHPYFDGRTWHSNETVRGPNPPALGAVSFPAGPDGVIALAKSDPRNVTTTIVPRSPGALVLAPSGALSMQAAVPGVRMDAYQVLTWGDVVPDRYVVRHRLDSRMVRPGDNPLPFWPDSSQRMRAVCLLLPPKVDPRVRELAEKISASAQTPEQRLRHTLEFLQTGYTYTLKPGKFRTFDPLAEFLFEKKKGYCEYFATAAAVLLRLQGIPTRYVTGYSVQAGNRNGDHYVVRERDGHAWIEVFLPGQGWLEADPTPPGEYEGMVAGMKANWFDEAWEWLQVTASELWQRLLVGDWRGLWDDLWPLLWPTAMLAALGFATAWLVRKWRKRDRRRSAIAPRVKPVAAVGALDPALVELLASLDRKWTARGCARPASRAPLEHAQSLPPEIPLQLRAAGLRAVECFYRGCFAGIPPGAIEIREVRTSLDASEQV